MSGTLPPRYTTATMIGNGISGVVVTILRIATKEAFPPGLEGLLSSTRMYFSIATVFVVFCITCVVTIECVPIVKWYRKRNLYDLNQKRAADEALVCTLGVHCDFFCRLVAVVISGGVVLPMVSWSSLSCLRLLLNLSKLVPVRLTTGQTDRREGNCSGSN